jgi:dihydrofolate reductase
MTTFRLYIAVSADGYIATPDGTVLLGRKTYDQALGFGAWPYPGKKAVVWTSRALGTAPEGVEATGDLGASVARIRAEEIQDVCVVGGAQLIAKLLELQAIDELQLFEMPVLLGAGIPLFEKRAGVPIPLQLTELKQFPSGVAKLVYRLA